MGAHRFSFYCPSLRDTDGGVELSDDEHHHLARVLRLERGGSIYVTNGRGLLVAATIEVVGERSTRARVERIERRDPPPARLVLALAPLSHARTEAALAGCVEAGITEFIPVRSERGHVRAEGENRTRRLERVAVAAMKQSGRAWVPRVSPSMTLDSLAASCADFARVVLADAGGPAISMARSTPRDTLAIVGPEAGFTDSEIRTLCDAGAGRVSISDHRLRAETAAVVLIAMLAAIARAN